MRTLKVNQFVLGELGKKLDLRLCDNEVFVGNIYIDINAQTPFTRLCVSENIDNEFYDLDKNEFVSIEENHKYVLIDFIQNLKDKYNIFIEEVETVETRDLFRELGVTDIEDLKRLIQLGKDTENILENNHLDFEGLKRQTEEIVELVEMSGREPYDFYHFFNEVTEMYETLNDNNADANDLSRLFEKSSDKYEELLEEFDIYSLDGLRDTLEKYKEMENDFYDIYRISNKWA